MKSVVSLIGGLVLCSSSMAQEAYPFVSTPVAEFNEPWAMEFLPDGRLLVTEKGGSLLLVTQDGSKTEVAGAPSVDYFFQGGLGDIVLHPEFASNNTVYVSYVEAGPNETRGAAVARATFNAATPGLENLEVIWRAEPKVDQGLHFSLRIAFDSEGLMYVSSGERNKMDPAQDVNSSLGKIVRLNDDGSPAAGNPFAAEGGKAAEVWSLGHRNPLGIAFDPQSRLWNVEMAPRGGDELNLVKAGANYGYPLVSEGIHYDGKYIPDHATDTSFEAPKVWWNPVISPSSLMFYTGDKFSGWSGNAFIGGLSSQSIIRVAINGENASEAQRFVMGKRIRGLEQGPDGNIWALEDGAGGRLLKLTPR
ncbi:MAG TPA: PQQ-dependent sugar dehydrogenase [Pseudomonadaceae bacterium]|nr:PQQ-dependent sugar dehydrogenase [Pseudomonadaceae bacterium]